MAVLIDNLREYPNRPYRIKQWCHMGTDDHTNAGIDELHEMATRIGMKRHWFQDKPRFPHYDVSASRRSLAIKYGAKEVDSSEYVRKTRRGFKDEQ